MTGGLLLCLIAWTLFYVDELFGNPNRKGVNAYRQTELKRYCHKGCLGKWPEHLE